MPREKDEICDTDGEQYEATTVNTVLGNPAVTLTEADRDGVREQARARCVRGSSDLVHARWHTLRIAGSSG